VGLLLDALRQLPGVRALLVGEPPDTPLPERAQATGVVPSIAAFLRRGTMLVLPSHQEGFGIVGAEAMAAGLPLVTLDPWTVGGTQTHARELVRALAEHGTLDYRVYVSEIAPEAGGELRTV